MQLFLEAEKIRESLLQESFTMRRSLELSLGNQVENIDQFGEDWLEKIESFHQSLQELNDRLSPAYIEDSLPLAIQCIVEAWKRRHPQLKFEMKLPVDWRQETLDRSRVILMALDELLRITLSEHLKEASIFISLMPQGKLGELQVQIAYPDVGIQSNYLGLKDLDYLCQAFRFLTSGQCFCERNDLTVTWYFRWRSQKPTLHDSCKL
jgi:hypothetical protein